MNAVTEQLTESGRQIEHASFAIIDREAGTHRYRTDQWTIVRRLIHATGDFEFNGLTRFHPQAVDAGVTALLAGRPIVADVQMVVAGIASRRLASFGLTAYQFIDDQDVIADAARSQTTRAVQAMRKAQRLDLLNGSIIAVGNAPTALLELVRLIREANVHPALLVGMPVGFVAAAESKQALAELTIPWIITAGRKGGSTLAVATIHALLALAATHSRPGGR
ncbi:MAG: precorrin-8X methylmutase [Gammaproteobacteria bacterium]